MSLLCIYRQWFSMCHAQVIQCLPDGWQLTIKLSHWLNWAELILHVKQSNMAASPSQYIKRKEDCCVVKRAHLSVLYLLCCSFALLKGFSKGTSNYRQDGEGVWRWSVEKLIVPVNNWEEWALWDFCLENVNLGQGHWIMVLLGLDLTRQLLMFWNTRSHP